MVVAQVFTIKLNHELSEIDYDNIIQWVKNILPKGKLSNKTSMMKLIGLRKWKIDMCPNL